MTVYSLLAFFYLSVFTFPLSAQADWSPRDCKISDQQLAEELLSLILAGFQLNEPTPCMKQDAFKHVLAGQGGNEEFSPRADILFTDKDKVVVTAVNKSADGYLEANVDWQWSKNTTGSYPDKSTFVFRRYHSLKLQKQKGCGVILKDFDKIIVRASCYRPLAETFKSDEEIK